MALTDTFVKQVKPTDNPAGDKYADGGGMYLFLIVYLKGEFTEVDLI